MGNKYLDDSWDFIGADTKTVTHCLHAYPAMMIPQICARLITLYGSAARWLFDPYCGTGTSLVESNLRGINAIGTDLNPLARLIAQAKTTSLNLQVLDLYLKDFNDYLFTARFGIRPLSVVVPTIKNIDYWFAPRIQKELAYIQHFIQNIADADIARFFNVAFSETVRESSWTRNGEFKMFRMTAEQMRKFQPDAFGIIQNKLVRNRAGLRAFMAQRCMPAVARVADFDTVVEIPPEIISSDSIDVVITSPPYGDSRTTVAYGQFSRLANEWLGVTNATQVDRQLMGGTIYKEAGAFDCAILDETIAAVEEKDKKRAQEVVAFYRDYRTSIRNVARVIRPGGYACYVVGNRRVKGITLPTDEITRAFFEASGFTHVETIIRHIPNKRMPSRNSPTNVAGALDTTMNREYIVVMARL